MPKSIMVIMYQFPSFWCPNY